MPTSTQLRNKSSIEIPSYHSIVIFIITSKGTPYEFLHNPIGSTNKYDLQ